MSHTIESIQKLMSKSPLVLYDCPEELYHSFPAFSNSGMKEFEKAPGIYDFMKKNPSEDTNSRRSGRLLHLAIGQPDRIKSDVAVVDGHRGGKEVKALVEAYEAAGKLVVKSDQIVDKLAAAEYCRKHKLVSKILQRGKAEVSIFWIDKLTKAPCKARLDWVTDSEIIADWKEFDPNYDEGAIERQIHTMNYHYQHAWYIEAYTQGFGHPPKDFYNVFIRTKNGIRVQVTRIVDQAIEEVIPIIRSHLLAYSKCLQTQDWSMNDEEVLDIVIKPFFK